VREIYEEAGLHVTAHRLFSVRHKAKHPYDPDARDFYKLFFLCDDLSQAEPASGHETASVDFFPLDTLPPLSLGRVLLPPLSLGRVLESDIAAAFAARSNPERPVLFD
jgi:ADP-ribose pyrophosphatase YjhB (NUDIX family)